MLNRSGIDRQTATAPVQILANVEMQMSVGCNIAPDESFDGKLHAGTPLFVDFSDLQKPAVPASATNDSSNDATESLTPVVVTEFEGFWPLEAIHIDVNTFKNNMYTDMLGDITDGTVYVLYYDVQQDTSAEDTYTVDWFLKKKGDESGTFAALSGGPSSVGITFDGPYGTGSYLYNTAYSATLELTYHDASASGAPNAVLLHDIEFNGSDPASVVNATALYFGTVNYNRLSTVVQTLYASLGIDCGVNAVGNVSILKA